MKLTCITCQHQFVSDSPSCPKCNSSRMVFPVVTTHMIAESDDGTIKSGVPDGRQYFAKPVCGLDRQINRETRDIAWVSEWERVNCPDCLAKKPQENKQ